jgi:proteasome lid subunit RPN8/RPN11
MGASVVFGPDAEAVLRDLAAAAYPLEGCGVLVGAVEGAGEGARVSVRSVSGAANLSPRGRDRYELDPLAIVRAERAAREAGLDVVGFWHSHPDHPAVPSRLDTERAWADYLYVIVSTSPGGSLEVHAWRLAAGGGQFVGVPVATADAAAEAGR